MSSPSWSPPATTASVQATEEAALFPRRLSPDSLKAQSSNMTVAPSALAQAAPQANRTSRRIRQSCLGGKGVPAQRWSPSCQLRRREAPGGLASRALHLSIPPGPSAHRRGPAQSDECTESLETPVSVSVEVRLSQTQRDPRNPQRFALGSRPHPVPRGTIRG
jgi:hypothetical protein